MSSSEKRHELDLIKLCHEELERQYQESIRFKEKENCLKFEQSQLDLEQLAESHKKQLIEMEMEAFELEDSSSEVSEAVAESSSTGVSLPISKVATDRTNDWVDSVSSQAHPDVASVPGLLAFTPVPVSSEPTTSAHLAHAINTSYSHNHEHTALSDAGIHSHGHRAMPQFGSASLLPLQASVPSVSFPVNNMHSSAHVLPPPSAVPLQTMSSNITNGSFAIGQPESLPFPDLRNRRKVNRERGERKTVNRNWRDYEKARRDLIFDHAASGFRPYRDSFFDQDATYSSTRSIL